MKKTLICLALIAFFSGTIGVKAAEAAAHLTLTPTTKTVNSGDTFDVVVGIESGTDKVFSADVWMTFDASKLEVESVNMVGAPAFPFSLGTKNIDNTAGTIKIGLNPTSTNNMAATTASGGLLTINFKAKNTGVAAATFTCAPGNLNDTNIIDPTYNEIIDCASNQSGSYTINAGSSTTPSNTPTPTPVTSSGSTVTTPTNTPANLPQTGTDGPTIGLVLFGLMSIVGSIYLRRI